MYLKTAILILLLYSFTANSTNQIDEKGLASNLGYYLLLEKKYISSDQQKRKNSHDINYARINYKQKNLALSKNINTNLNISLEFADQYPKWKDLNIEFTNYNQRLKIGQFKAPNSFIKLSNLQNLSFSKLPALTEFLPDRKFGINYKLNLGNFLISAAIQTQTINHKFMLKNPNYQIVRIAHHSNFAPIPNLTLHLATSYNANKDKNITYKISEINYQKNSLSDLITNNFTNIKQSNLHIIELALIKPKAILISEYARNKIAFNQADALNFSGYYFNFKYNLIGQNFSYNQLDKTYNSSKMKNNLEIAYRKSFINLNKNQLKFGSYKSDSVALNYHLTANIKFFLNYTKIKTDKYAYQAFNSPEILSFNTELSF